LGRGPESEYFGAFSAAAGRALAGFGHLLRRWQEALPELTPLSLLDRIVADVDYQTYLDDGSEEGMDRWENVLELRRLAAEAEGEHKGLTEFLEGIALVSDQDTVDASANVPTLLTLHAAKGLEFRVVFITGLEDGTLPHARSFEDPEGMAEERRLFYVGITRAKEHLFLVHALNRSTYGYSEPADPSRFLDDIPTELVTGNAAWNTSYPSQRRVRQAATWDAKPAPSAAVIEPSYSPGQKVLHPTYGQGMVLKTEMDDGEEIVDVFFENGGLKKLVASLAKLEVVE
ncbi:MAG: 3'-5' exonuclease, partial [Anaerolineales bacterium]